MSCKRIQDHDLEQQADRCAGCRHEADGTRDVLRQEPRAEIRQQCSERRDPTTIRDKHIRNYMISRESLDAKSRLRADPPAPD